jgi:hypothetical protein
MRRGWGGSSAARGIAGSWLGVLYNAAPEACRQGLGLLATGREELNTSAALQYHALRSGGCTALPNAPYRQLRRAAVRVAVAWCGPV